MRLKNWHEWWHRERADVAALGSIALFFVAFFPQALAGRRFIIAGDALSYSYPLRTIAWRMIRHGQLPLWTPYVLSGYPLLSMAQVAVGYPLTWSYVFLPGQWAEQVYVLAPFLLSPIFTYAYLRELRRSPLAALLGALTFGYGGMMASPLSNSGLITNAVLWLPLLLIALERARRRPFVSCLLATTLAYALSVLSGHAQSFLSVGLLAGAYAVWLVLTVDDEERRTLRMRLRSARQWRPLLVICGAGLLAMGVAAFQILETARVVRRSVRSTLSYELFTQGSFKPADLWRSLTTPLFYVIDMHAYVPPLAVALACVAVYSHLRRRTERDPRVFFWCAVAVLACVLMMGQFTPFYRLVYHLPLLNLFRVPSRHTSEWTFAAGVLAAYGWDVLAPVLHRRREARTRPRATTLYAALVLLALGIFVGALWWLKAQPLRPDASRALSHTTVYLLWKGAFVLLTLVALWRASLIAQARWRFGLVLATVLVLCFVEPSLLIARWWGGAGLPASRFTTASAATRYLQQFPPADNRIYTRVDLMSEQDAALPRFDAANLAAVWGLHDVAGYEPLILERYSQALGGVWLDAVHTLDPGPPDASLFKARSHVLDILNTTFVVSYPHLATSLGGVASAPADPHSAAWQPVYEQHETLILRNTRALPRAWLVAEAEAVDGEVALSRIRGESAPEFDPRRTALLEVHTQELPALPGGALAPGSTARVVAYEPNRLVIDTNSPTATVLIVSEMFYPGWEATVDGRRTQINVADFLLRGVALAAGQHQVEMRYTAPAAHTGAIISCCTLLLLCMLFIYGRKDKPPPWSRVTHRGLTIHRAHRS